MWRPYEPCKPEFKYRVSSTLSDMITGMECFDVYANGHLIGKVWEASPFSYVLNKYRGSKSYSLEEASIKLWDRYRHE